MEYKNGETAYSWRWWSLVSGHRSIADGLE